MRRIGSTTRSTILFTVDSSLGLPPSRNGIDCTYKRVYDNLEPGAWFEQIEISAAICCDDDSVFEDALSLHSWKSFRAAAETSGNLTTVFEEMRGRIQNAGFVNVQEKVLKMPFAEWPKHPVHKDVFGVCNKAHYLAGIEGCSMVSSRHRTARVRVKLLTGSSGCLRSLETRHGRSRKLRRLRNTLESFRR